MFGCDYGVFLSEGMISRAEVLLEICLLLTVSRLGGQGVWVPSRRVYRANQPSSNRSASPFIFALSQMLLSPCADACVPPPLHPTGVDIRP